MERAEINRMNRMDRMNNTDRTNRTVRVRARRRRARSQRNLLYIIIFLFILIVGLLSCKAFVHADESINSEGRVKSFKSITIYSGDDLNTIALQNITPEYSSPAAYIKEICFMNHISEDEKLIPGNYLVVPCYQ